MAAASLPVVDQAGTTRNLSGATDPLNASALVMAQMLADATTGVKALVDSAGRLNVHTGSSRAAYRYAKSAFSMVATPTVAIVIQGSATATVSIKRIALAGAATAAGSMPAVVARCSDAGTLNTAVLTAVTAAKHDSTNAAPSAVVSTVGTANYQTPPTVVANLGNGRVTFVALGSAATSGEGKPLVWEFTTRNDQPLVLRGTGEYITIAFGGAGIPSGGVLDFEIETDEYT